MLALLKSMQYIIFIDLIKFCRVLSWIWEMDGVPNWCMSILFSIYATCVLSIENTNKNNFVFKAHEARPVVLSVWQELRAMVLRNRNLMEMMSFIYLFIYLFIYFICSGFCHTLKWNSHGFTCAPHPERPRWCHLNWPWRKGKNRDVE